MHRKLSRDEVKFLKAAIDAHVRKRAHSREMIERSLMKELGTPLPPVRPPKQRRIHLCVDCGEPIYRQSVRCRVCAPKKRALSADERRERNRLRTAARLARMTPEEREEQRAIWRRRKRKEKTMEGSSS